MTAPPIGKVYLNGEFLPVAEARVSVMDRGFLFGDGVYEVIPCFDGKPFRLSQHLARLEDSLHAIHMDNPLTREQWGRILRALLAESPGAERSLYLQITRGSTGAREHAIPKGVKPTVFAMSSPIKKPAPGTAGEGITAVTLDDIRWKLCNIKTINILANLLLRQEARELGGEEAILIRDGLALEGAASNLFITTNGELITPPPSRHLLPGVTRDLILELAGAEGIPKKQADITEKQLRSADEIWLTSSTREIMPIVRLDNEPVANGQPGPIYRRMAAIYVRQRDAWRAEASW